MDKLSNTNLTYYPYIKKKIPIHMSFNLNALPHNDTPHQSNINNLKSNKYFTSTKHDDIKHALHQYNNNNNHITISKDIITSTEPRSTKIKTYKLKPKFESTLISNDSDGNGDNEDDDNDLSENKPCVVTEYNSTCSNGNSNRKGNSDNMQQQQQQVELVVNNNYDFEKLIIIEEYLNELVEDVEINKLKKNQNLLSIIEDIIKCYNNTIIYDNVFKIFDGDIELNKHTLQTICKDFHIQIVLFVYILLLINFMKGNKSEYLSGVKNISFYLHQNFIAFIFIVLMKYKESNNNDHKDNPMLMKCEHKINENKTWLSLSTYKKTMISNNKICKSILNKIIFQIRNELTTTYNAIKLQLINGEDIEMENILNLLSTYLKKIHKTKLHKVITTLQTLPEMHSLFQYTQSNYFVHYLPLSNMEYTLVLDLDETLVHFVQGNDDSNNMAQIRPGAKEFIDELSEYFEIVIFTAAKQDYADIVIDGVDTSNKVSARLYRNHTTKYGDGYVKDLSKLGRDLKRVVIVDNCAENFCLQPKNGLKITDFEGDPEDNELEYLKEDLIEMIEKKPNDIRECLEVIQHKMNERNNTMNNEDDVISKQSGDNNNNSHHSDIYIKDNEERSEHDQETSDQEDDECNDNI